MYIRAVQSRTLYISAQGKNWPVSFLPDNLSLMPGESANVQVTIELPAYPPANGVDTVTIEISSDRVGGVIAGSTLVTTGSLANTSICR